MDDPSQHCVDQTDSQEHVHNSVPVPSQPNPSSAGPTPKVVSLENLASDLRRNVNDEVTHACVPNTSSSASSSTRIEPLHAVESVGDKPPSALRQRTLWV